MADINPDILQRIVTVEKLYQYNISSQQYNDSQSVPVEQFCNGWIVRNIGTSNLTVNGDPLLPGESKTVGGNRGEVFTGRIDIVFDNLLINLCVVTQKYYMNIARNAAYGQSL